MDDDLRRFRDNWYLNPPKDNEPTEFEIWMADETGKNMANGLPEKEAKEKALSDWYTYKEPNA